VQWARERAAPDDHVITLSIGLKQSRAKELERELLEGKSLHTLSMIFLTLLTFRLATIGLITA
jgi:hypothetical protein